MAIAVPVPDAGGHFGTSTAGGSRPRRSWAALAELTTRVPGKAKADPRVRRRSSRDLLARLRGQARRLLSRGATGSARVVCCPVLLKREDLNHTGSHKINNVLGQALLTKRMGKTRVIAETGAGQHGVATATACALFGLDVRRSTWARSTPSARRSTWPGCGCSAPRSSRSRPASRTLKDAINEALRDWVATVDDHALPASARSPGRTRSRLMVRDFQRGHRRRGARAGAGADRAAAGRGRSPASAAAPTRSASSTRFIADAGGAAASASRPAATASRPASTPPRSAPARPACCTARVPTCCRTRTARRSSRTRSRPASTTRASARSTPGCKDTGRASYSRRSPTPEAMEAFALLCRTEGIIPAIESAHAARRRAAGSGRSWARMRVHPGQPVRPGRQGRRTPPVAGRPDPGHGVHEIAAVDERVERGLRAGTGPQGEPRWLWLPARRVPDRGRRDRGDSSAMAEARRRPRGDRAAPTPTRVIDGPVIQAAAHRALTRQAFASATCLAHRRGGRGALGCRRSS